MCTILSWAVDPVLSCENLDVDFGINVGFDQNTL